MAAQQTLHRQSRHDWMNASRASLEHSSQPPGPSWHAGASTTSSLPLVGMWGSLESESIFDDLGTPRGVPLLISWFLFLLAVPGLLCFLGTFGRPSATAASVAAPTSSLLHHLCQYRLKDAPGRPAVVIVFGALLLPTRWSCRVQRTTIHSLSNA